MTVGELRVAIVGAGIGGLTLAIALRQHGIHAEIYEKASELREVGAAVAFAANGERLLDRLGVTVELAGASMSPPDLVYRHWRDGRLLAEHSIDGGLHTLHRVDFQRALVKVWDDEVELGATLVDLDSGEHDVRLKFADGRTASAEVVIGADGVHSTVRNWLTGGPGDAMYSGTSGFRGLVPVERLPSLPRPDAVQFWLGPGGHLLHYPIADGSVINFLAVVDAPAVWHAKNWVVGTDPGEQVAAFAGWHPAVTEMIAATDLPQRWGLFAHPPLNSWSRGRVALLGDAAHAMLPHQGQGANQTVEDAVALANLLATEEIPNAFRYYERLRRTRTRQVQRSSWDTSAILHLPDGPEADERDRKLAKFPENFRWIHDYDVERALT
ncbi:MAG: monooxygenase [Amycolatopsis sp.]|jgi:salicylate hydroxylase|uniref:FAD-dependent monooxygenase n=1 Tax=Amycolatopsis sp. TaxID=37632 RepID=UPI0026328451|nr:FAD-dependent monooxygenase [Amycolatopsis sp.]MCU1683714.1 monooxygenase [Amycolatopsis sp.]